MGVSRHPLVYLSLAFALLLYCAVCAESRIQGRDQQPWANTLQQTANDGHGMWCIAKPNTNTLKLSRNIEFSCRQKGVDCSPIQPGGSCFRPETTISHASFAMNLFYKAAGKHSWDCHFNGTGIAVAQDPSFGTCIYPL
ncbi:major pollen allergen Ole e 10 isoform X2 [Ricinus communis]|uniref:major pollen allergen Ole e 10 isoform X2 n=1 Tax=Ricinus communis TaxID=3988 RepID=UPI00201A8EC3|nr:major pollen allergen Ole e 10 isoform X2 [Ricinus communis]